MTVLDARGVTLVRGDAVLLADVDVRVEAGQRWALLGGNGAGKSTLLSVLGARQFPTRGTVEVLGRRMGRTPVQELWPRIGQVHSGHVPAGRPTARQVVLTGASGTAALPLHRDPGSASALSLGDRVDALLERLGVAALAGHAWSTLSAGERGRVLLARALVNDPPLLLLDEPASGLDLPAREALVAALDDLAALDPARASVLVTHHLEELPASTTHALLLRGGRVLAAGTVGEVLTGPLLSACFGLPLRVAQEQGRWWARRA